MSVISPITVDSYVDQDRQSAKLGGQTTLKVRGSGSGHMKMAYLFVAMPFPLGASIVSAKLVLRLHSGWAGTNTLNVQRVIGAWNETWINWNKMPATDPLNAASASLVSLVDKDTAEVDITAMVADISAGAKYTGLRLALTQDVMRSIYSTEISLAELRPRLEIEWSEAPDQPSNLVPSGGNAVSIAKPTLGWQFSDNVGNTQQAHSQVQIASEPTFAAPLYDSAKVANTVPLWNLAPTAYSIADSEVRYWRVRVWDGAGLVSGWSAAAQFTRRGKGTLVLTNPPASPNNKVEETTPPIIWTFTGRTQEAASVELYRVGAGNVLTLLWRQPMVASTADSITLPAGLLRTGETYRVRVMINDTINRQSTPGDPSYVIAERDFTYVRAGTPAPVTSLVATAPDARVVLTFQRTAAPDFFALRVNGVEVMDRLDPAELPVVGSTYTLEYWGATPRKLNTFEVEAVVNDLGTMKHSGGNATAQVMTKPVGIWLVDIDDSTAVMIAGKEKASMAIGETGTTFAVLGSRSPVRITDSVRGYEGTFNGILLDTADRDTFLELKGRLKPLRLIIGDLNIPVRLEDVSTMPDPMGDRGYTCSFGFFQDGEETFEVVG